MTCSESITALQIAFGVAGGIIMAAVFFAVVTLSVFLHWVEHMEESKHG